MKKLLAAMFVALLVVGCGSEEDTVENKPTAQEIAVQKVATKEVLSQPVRLKDFAGTEAEKLNIEGNDLGRSGEWTQAEGKFTSAIAIDSEYHEPWYNRGKARLNQRKYKGAISDFDKALTLYLDAEGIADILNNRGIAKKNAGYVAGAILDYSKALKKNPKLYRVYVNRGIAYYELGKKKQAISDFRIARDHGEKQGAEALRQLGIQF
jgi:tetratricopeptide (TPR) repeat protein